jgi:hypothetical protein
VPTSVESVFTEASSDLLKIKVIIYQPWTSETHWKINFSSTSCMGALVEVTSDEGVITMKERRNDEPLASHLGISRAVLPSLVQGRFGFREGEAMPKAYQCTDIMPRGYIRLTSWKYPLHRHSNHVQWGRRARHEASARRRGDGRTVHSELITKLSDNHEIL